MSTATLWRSPPTGAQAGTYGTITIVGDGSYSYALNNGNAAVQALGVGETLTETFNYSISDGNGGTATSTLTITITGTNDGPVANDDATTVAEDAAAPVTGNCADQTPMSTATR